MADFAGVFRHAFALGVSGEYLSRALRDGVYSPELLARYKRLVEQEDAILERRRKAVLKARKAFRRGGARKVKADFSPEVRAEFARVAREREDAAQTVTPEMLAEAERNLPEPPEYYALGDRFDGSRGAVKTLIESQLTQFCRLVGKWWIVEKPFAFAPVWSEAAERIVLIAVAKPEADVQAKEGAAQRG